SMHLDMVPPERPASTGIYGWLVPIIGEARRRVQPGAPLSRSPLAGARRGSVDPHARTPNTQVRVIENTYPSSSSGGRLISPEQFEHHGIRHPVHHKRRPPDGAAPARPMSDTVCAGYAPGVRH